MIRAQRYGEKLLIIFIIYKINFEFLVQKEEGNLLRIDDIPEIDASTSSEINSKFTMYLREGESEKQREPFYCKELGKSAFESFSTSCTILFLNFIIFFFRFCYGEVTRWIYSKRFVECDFVIMKIEK